MREAFDRLGADFGRPPSVVIVVAGLRADALLVRMTLAQFDRVVTGNATSTFLVLREAGRSMVRTGGSIVVVSSIAADVAGVGQANYASAKSALNALVRTAAREFAPFGIRVNAVAPGLTRTGFIDGMPPRDLRAQVGRIPLRRMGDPAEIAAAVGFLAGSGASYITGAILPVDGGAAC